MILLPLVAVSWAGGTIDFEAHLAAATRSPQAAESAVQTAIQAMDGVGIEISVLMPPPCSLDNVGRCGGDEVIAATVAHPKRFVRLAGGETLNPMILQLDEPVAKGKQEEFRATAEALLEGGARGFGEMSALHLSFNDNHVFTEVAPDHQLFRLLADIAAERNVVINLHMEAVVEDMATPALATQASSRNPPTLHANIPAFERLLSHNPGAKILWTHAGWDTGDRTVALQRRLLKAHPNLYMGVKVMREPPHRRRANRPLDQQDRIEPDWLALVAEFPDRFVMSSDQFHGELAGHGRTPQHLPETPSFVQQLPEGLREKVGRENARRLLGL